MSANKLDHTKTFNGLRLISGQTGLDLFNTVKYRGAVDDGDRFVFFIDIVEWALLVNIIDKKEYNLLDSHKNLSRNTEILKEICELREHARVLFDAKSYDTPRINTAIKCVESNVCELRPTVKINRKTGVLEKFYPLTHPKDLKSRIVACIDNLLQNRELLTIKCCSGQDCDWLFVDNTKAKRRKWCDTRTCGNLSRVRKHRGN